MHGLQRIHQYFRRAPAVFCLSVLAVAAFAFPGLEQGMEFKFADLGVCNILPMIGSNCLHWSLSHLFWDLMMFYCIGSLCEMQYPRTFMWVMLICGPIIPLSALLACPDLGSYRGLSGIDTALFGLLASHRLREAFDKRDTQGAIVNGLLLMAMVLKIIYELIWQHTLFADDSTFTPIASAHLVGAVIGVSVSLLDPGRINAESAAQCG